jgi:hypothetical protein
VRQTLTARRRLSGQPTGTPSAARAVADQSGGRIHRATSPSPGRTRSRAPVAPCVEVPVCRPRLDVPGRGGQQWSLIRPGVNPRRRRPGQSAGVTHPSSFRTRQSHSFRPPAGGRGCKGVPVRRGPTPFGAETQRGGRKSLYSGRHRKCHPAMYSFRGSRSGSSGAGRSEEVLGGPVRQAARAGTAERNCPATRGGVTAWWHCGGVSQPVVRCGTKKRVKRFRAKALGGEPCVGTGVRHPAVRRWIVTEAGTRPPRCPVRLLPVACGPALADNP